MSRSAIVLGGGIAGLAAAIALRDAGYRVELFEQAEAIEPLGAALSLWPNAIAALRRLGALDRIAATAAPIEAMLLATREGRPLLGPWPVSAALHGEAAYLPTRALLQEALAGALGDVPVHLARQAIDLRNIGDGAEVVLEDSERRRADLIVVADGLWSGTGDTLVGNPARRRGYGGVLALSNAADGPPLDGLAAEYWGDGERFGVFDLGEGRRYWFYMHREPAPTPPHDALLAKAATWPRAVAEAIAATPAHRLIPVTIAARSVPRRLGRGRIICVGDAAHGMEPNLGQGACQALEDAVVLGALAASVPPAALSVAFTRARRTRIAAMMRRAAEGGLAAHGSAPVRWAFRAVLRTMPAAFHRQASPVSIEPHSPERER